MSNGINLCLASTSFRCMCMHESLCLSCMSSSSRISDLSNEKEMKIDEGLSPISWGKLMALVNFAVIFYFSHLSATYSCVFAAR